jgi:IS1 family transposase
MFDRLWAWNARFYFADGYQAYAELIPRELLVQSKAETHLIESNNMPQRHWFARFRRECKSNCVIGLISNDFGNPLSTA